MTPTDTLDEDILMEEPDPHLLGQKAREEALARFAAFSPRVESLCADALKLGHQPEVLPGLQGLVNLRFPTLVDGHGERRRELNAALCIFDAACSQEAFKQGRVRPQTLRSGADVSAALTLSTLPADVLHVFGMWMQEELRQLRVSPPLADLQDACRRLDDVPVYLG